MNELTLFIFAFIAGGIAAVPAGPVQIEVIRRSVNGHLKPALMVIFGAFLVDAFYGFVAFFGIAPFLEDEQVMALFWLAGSCLLLFLGIYTIKQNLHQGKNVYDSRFLRKKRWSFLGGITLSATNPVMILWWLSSAHIFKNLGLIDIFSNRIILLFLTAGTLGLASYLIVLSFILYIVKEFIPQKKMRKINIGFGFILILLSGYFLTHSISHLF